jgi:hypothetical protein
VRRGLSLLAGAALALCAACEDPIDAGGSTVDAGPDDDPLVFDDPLEPGSLEELHRTIIQPGCAGQPGLCHAGQFEPNMATPAAFYASVVNRPGIEHRDQRRVVPGDPDSSLLVDKLRHRNGVATQMPLGAEPLSEEKIAAIEAWIADGALRRPGAAPPPTLNELPEAPEVALYVGNARVDGSGPAQVSVGQTLTFRLSTRDFETSDVEIPAVILAMVAPDGRSVVVRPLEMQDPHLALLTYDAAGPMGLGDQLNRRFDFTIPATVTLYDEPSNTRTPDVPVSGMTFSVFAVYVDGFGPDGMAALAVRQSFFEVN